MPPKRGDKRRKLYNNRNQPTSDEADVNTDVIPETARRSPKKEEVSDMATTQQVRRPVPPRFSTSEIPMVFRTPTRIAHPETRERGSVVVESSQKSVQNKGLSHISPLSGKGSLSMGDGTLACCEKSVAAREEKSWDEEDVSHSLLELKRKVEEHMSKEDVSEKKSNVPLQKEEVSKEKSPFERSTSLHSDVRQSQKRHSPRLSSASARTVEQQHRERTFELELSTAQKEAERCRIEANHWKMARKTALEDAEIQIAELQEQQRFLVEAEKETAAKMNSLRAQCDERTAALQALVDELTGENAEVARQRGQEQKESWNALQDIRCKLREAESQVAIKDTELQHLRSEACQFAEKLQSALADAQRMPELESELARAQSALRKLEEINAHQVEELADAKGLRSRVLKLEEETRAQRKDLVELGLLRRTRDNVSILKEENMSLRQQVDAAEELRMKHEKLCVVHEASIKERDTVLEDEKAKALQTRAALNREVERLMEIQGSLRGELTDSQQKLKSLEGCIGKVTCRAEAAELSARQTEDALARADRQLVFITKARDGMRRILSTYEAEQETKSSSLEKERIDVLEESMEAAQVELRKLEGALREKDREAKELRQNAASCRPGGSDDSLQVMELQRLQKDKADLQAEVKRLLNEVGSLEHMVGRGDFNPETTKVLHVKMNPETEVRLRQKSEEIQLLKDENARLVALLQSGSSVAQEGNDCSHGAVEVTSLRKEMTACRLKISQLEKARTRLVQVFAHKSKEFREVAYLLTGYRIDMVDVAHQYRVQSMFAEQEDDHFLFKTGRRGQIDMLATPYSEKWRESVEVFLTRLHSIPAFLAHVTSELFKNQTVTTS